MTAPEPRVFHTMVQMEEEPRLVLFGGNAAYMPSLHMTRSFNDVWLFDVANATWTEVAGRNPPAKRTQHVSGLLGSIMLVHGGYNCEGKVTLNDFCLFDLDECQWIKTRITNQNNQQVVISPAVRDQLYERSNLHAVTDDQNSARDPMQDLIIFRRGHCMTSAYDEQTLRKCQGRRGWIADMS